MAARKSVARPRVRRASNATIIRKSMEIGKKAALQVQRERAVVLRRREKVIGIARKRAIVQAARVEPRFVRAAGADGIATLVAEGDSWFDYPFYDVLKLLDDEHGYEVESVAHKGDRVEDMAYAGDQLRNFKRSIEKLLRRGDVPKAILLSGGGNDIAGEEFSLLLDHADSAAPGLNDDVVRGVIDTRIRNAYITILTAITELCVFSTGRQIPILTHGYARSVPDGRGVAGGWGFLPGPWLRPGFHQKGFFDQDKNRKTLGNLIDRFNDMMKGVVTLPSFRHVRFVDLRTLLPNDGTYRTWWGNELHPTKKGFKAVADQFAGVIANL